MILSLGGAAAAAAEEADSMIARIAILLRRFIDSFASCAPHPPAAAILERDRYPRWSYICLNIGDIASTPKTDGMTRRGEAMNGIAEKTNEAPSLWNGRNGIVAFHEGMPAAGPKRLMRRKKAVVIGTLLGTSIQTALLHLRPTVADVSIGGPRLNNLRHRSHSAPTTLHCT